MKVGADDLGLISTEVEAVEVLERFGFPEIDRPIGDYPILREDHADLSPKDLGELHNRFTRWFEYANYRFSRLKAVALGKQEMYDDGFRLEMATQTGSAEIRKQRVLLQDNIRRLRLEMIRAQQEVLLVEGVVTRLKYNMTVVSRLVTIRQEEIRANYRDTNIGNARLDKFLGDM